MTRLIEEMAGGNMNMERPSDLSYDESISFEVFEGSEFTDSFRVQNNSPIQLDGDVVCNCHNITSLKAVSDKEGLTIEFVFDSKSKKAGKTVTGEFCIISNAGEFTVPFMASIVAKRLVAGVGEIKNLDEFIRFYSINPGEAAKLYNTEAFEEFLTNTKAKLYYKKLRDVEEFLIAIGAKKRTRFTLSKNEIVFSELLKDEYEEVIKIGKSNTGILNLHVRVDAPFIEVSKKEIYDDDFIGAQYSLKISLKKSKLHLGENLGCITIWNNFQEEKINIKAIVATEIDITKEKYRTGKHKFLKLCRLYESYLAENIVTGHFVKEVIAIADSMPRSELLYKLIKAYAFLINSQNQEFRWLIADIKNDVSREYVGTYMLYSCLLYMGEPDSDYREKIFSEIVDIYQENMDSAFVRYCMLLIDSETIDSKNKLVMIIKWIKEGENSPFFYGYAMRLLNEYPFFLTDLKREMLLILNWGSRHNFIGRALTEQILSLYSTAGHYDILLDRILTRCQSKYPTKDTLTAVCAYRIKGELTREIDHLWYRKAIDEDIKLTGLYEYYIASMGKGMVEQLPNQVCLYFQYNNFLSRKQKAVLYMNVVSYKEQDPRVFDVYKKTIKDYVVAELSAGHIDENLSVLYNEFFDELKLDLGMYDNLSNIVYVNRLVCTNPYAKYVYVIHENLAEPLATPIKDGVAYAVVIPGEYVYVFADENGRFFTDNESCEPQKLFSPARLMRNALEEGSLKVPYILHYFLTKQSMLGLNETEVSYLRVLMESPLVSEEYKRRLSPVLVKYHSGSFEADAIMKDLDVSALDDSSRVIYIDGLIKECLYGKAFEFVDYYGPDSVSLNVLEQIIMYCLTYIKDYDEKLCALMKYAVSRNTGKQIIYKYLNRYMQGTSDEMYDVWVKAKSLNVELAVITEKLLFLMIFTGEIKRFAGRLFSYYVMNGKNRSLIRAYVNYFAYSYITECIKPSAEAFEILINDYRTIRDVPEYVSIALLKYLSCRESLERNEEGLCEDILCKLLSKDIYFGFYKNLPKSLQVRFHLYDRYIVTIKSPEAEPSVYYRLDDGNMKKCELKNVFLDYYTFMVDACGSNRLYYYVDETGKRFMYRGALRTLKSVNENIENRYSYINSGSSLLTVKAMDMTVEKLFLPV